MAWVAGHEPSERGHPHPHGRGKFLPHDAHLFVVGGVVFHAITLGYLLGCALCDALGEPGSHVTVGDACRMHQLVEQGPLPVLG